MKAENIVVHFTDGRLLKGTSVDFDPPASTFHLRLADTGKDDPPVCVSFNDLKAVFFVRDLVGDRNHVYRNQFGKGQSFMGRKVRVTFADGEVMVGWTMGYGERGHGFFLFPADTKGNTLRTYVVGANVRSIALEGP